VVFGTLLSANVVVLHGFQQRLDLTSRAFLENAVVSEADLQLAAVGFSALSSFQHKLETTSFDCGDAMAVLGSTVIRSSSKTPVADLLLSVQSTARYTGQGSRFDNLSALRPFGGFVPGYLNFEVVLSASSRAADLAFAKFEHHVFHIPLLLDQSISVCKSAARYLVSGLEALFRNPLECSARNLDAVLKEASRLYDGASSDGLLVSFAGSFVLGDKCGPIEYSVTILEPNVVGVDGLFTWRLSEAGSISP
jgi:hypothetical protein